MQFKRSAVFTIVFSALISTISIAQAQITGFGGSSMSGWTSNNTSGGPVSVSGAGNINDVLTVTTANNGITNSYFYNAPQPMTSGGWNANFIYNYTGTTNVPADGLTFTLQNDARGASAIGGGGGELGYGGGPGSGIINSQAFDFNVYSGDNGVGVWQSVNGGANTDANSNSYLNTSPVNLIGGGTIGVSLSYNGGTSVNETLTQGANTFNTSFTVPGYQTVLGGNNSFLVGFTGATGGLNAGQQISQFQFTPVGSQVPKIQTIFHPGDVIVGTQTSGGPANSPGGEPAPDSIDNAAESKYLNFNAGGSAIYETPALGLTIANSLSLTSANDSPERDPATYEVWGTNDPNPNDTNPVLNPAWASFYTLISSGAVPAFPGRFTEESIPFANSSAYATYVVDFPTVADPGSANSMQVADIQLSGPLPTPEPGTFALFAIAGLGLLVRRRAF